MINIINNTYISKYIKKDKNLKKDNVANIRKNIFLIVNKQ